MIVDPVTEDEVFERLRLVLAGQGVALQRGSLDAAAGASFGRFFTTRADDGSVLEKEIDLERWARREGSLRPNESLVPSHGAVD